MIMVFLSQNVKMFRWYEYLQFVVQFDASNIFEIYQMW